MIPQTRPPLRRLLRLDQMIRAGEYPNANTAAQELEVSSRTIHRDLDFLRNSWGAPLEFSQAHNGYFYTDPDYAVPLLRLTQGEMVALFLAERLLQEYAATPYASALATLFQKITANLPDVTIEVPLAGVYSVRHQKPKHEDTEVFGQLARAVHQSLQLELSYWSASSDTTTTRVVDPYHLASVSGVWYLVAYCHLREEVRMFVPGRIRSLKQTGESFERPADFAIEDYLDSSFRTFRGDGELRTVSIRFAPEIARYIRERQWHPSQVLEEHSDGSLVVTLRVSHLLEVKRWILSYGVECEVLEP